ncbi:hypothetical protein JCM13210_24530 [Thermaerobacter litoralis]
MEFMSAERVRNWLGRWRLPWPRSRGATWPGDAGAGSVPLLRGPQGSLGERGARTADARLAAAEGAGHAGRQPGGRFVLRGSWSPRPRGAVPAPADPDDFDWVGAVEQARRDWEQARLYFESVTDRDLVDQAIHLVLAAEKRYAYLLKQARRRGIQGLPAHPGEGAGRQAAP